MMTAPARQDKKPPVVIGMPSDVDSQPVSAKSNELVTSANRPKVRRYRGKASVLTTGLMIEFTSVNTRATTASTITVSDADEDDTEIDGTRRVDTHSPAIVANKRAMNSICQFLRNGTLFARRTRHGIGLDA